jgi:hypothetical protein
LFDVFRLEVVKADFVYEGVECGRFDSKDGLEVEALCMLAGVLTGDGSRTYSWHVLLHASHRHGCDGVFCLTTQH